MAARRATTWVPAAAFLAAAALTAVVVAVPAARMNVSSSTVGPIVLATAGVAQLLAALLTGQRFGRTGSIVHFVLAAGLGVTGLADVVFSLWRAVPDADAVSPLVLLPYHVVGAALLALAAWMPDRSVLWPPRHRLLLATVVQVPLGLLLLQETGILRAAGAGTSGAHSFGVLLLRIGACALLAIAALGFARERDRRADPLLRWLIAAVGIGALAQLHRAAVPVPSNAGFSWAHVLQLGAVASLLAGCAGEVRAHRRCLEEAAVAQERRRMARDLHDGLVQELAFIASQSKDIAAHSDEDRFELIAASAQRALDDSRYVVGALGRASGQPLRATITLQAREFARRWGLEVRVAVADEMDLGPDKERAVLRIVGEALSNAARHADATTVDIEVGNRNGHSWIAVSDDGRGFDSAAAEAAERGFGLRSMRERAELLGGDLRLESAPGNGTRVEIALS